MILLATVPAVAAIARDDDRKDVRRGNRNFAKGEFREAVVDYQKALLRDSASFAASYNLANALYRLENYQEARSVLDTVAGQAPVSGYSSDYYYNTGNTALALKDYQGAVDAYRSALLANPGDLDAKENYIYAKKKLEDQQNNQNNQNNQDNQNNQNNQDNKDNRDNKDNENDKDRDDRNDDSDDNGRNQDDSRQQQSGQQPQPQISKQAAQQMLNAIMAKEKETQDKVKKEKAAVMKSRQREKNW